MTETLRTKRYIGNIGWSGNTKHIIVATETADGKSHKGNLYAICKPNTGMHYRIGPITQLNRVAATAENITCKTCTKWIK